MSDLGERIRDARERRRWDQAELVRRLAAAGVSVSQQTISRWERGQTSARGRHLIALTDLLELAPPDDQTDRPPSRDPIHTATEGYPALLTQLRFDLLSPEQFESFAADLATALFAPARAVRIGAQGHKQDGIDVAVEHADHTITGIQCKREQEFGPAKARKAVAALEVEVRQCLIFLSRVASPGVRKEIRQHDGWELWDADDLSRAIRRLPRDEALRIVDTFFPGMRQPFLGIATPGPWQDAAAFYAPFMSDRVFSHQWPLFGQGEALDEIIGAVSTANNGVSALIGRGGLGKTRLLRDVAARVREGGTEVRFLATSAPVAPADIDLLPPGDLLVVVDDAHDRSDLAFIIGSIRRARPDVRTLLALRPYGWDSCLSILSSLGLHSSELPTVSLPELSSDSAEQLAKTCLPDGAHQTAPSLAAVGRDCPLLIVVGAALVRRGALDATSLTSSPAIAEEILRRFTDVVTGDGSSPGSRLRQAVLRALAVLQPLRTDVESFRDAASMLTGHPYEQVSAELSALEDTGVVLRREASLRIVPDLLGDAVLEQAFFDRAGYSTGYVDRVRSAATGPALDNALRNAARVDWRVTDRLGTPVDVIDPLWAALDADFKASGVAGRRQLADTLQAIAQFQPRRTLELVQWAVDHPTVDEDDAVLWGGGPTYDHVLHELAPVLHGVCVSPEYLPAAADLLWRLGRVDRRQLHQHPHHPVRVLTELAQFQQHKPIWVTEAVIDRVADWLNDPDTSATAYSPLEVLRPMLATEGHSQRSDGWTVTFTPFGLNPAGVAGFRRKALDLAFGQLGHPDFRQAVRAVDVIGDGLRYPRGGWGRTPSTEEQEAWTPLIVETLDGLRGALRQHRPDPTVEVALRFELQLSYASSEWNAAAKDVHDELSTSTEAQVALYLHDGWNQLGRNHDNYESAAQAHRTELRKVALSLGDWPAASVVELVARRLATDRRAFTNRAGFPSPFFRVLFDELTDVAAAVCETVIVDPSNPLFEAIADAVTALVTVDQARASTFVGRLAGQADPRVDQQLASALTWSRRDGETVSDDDRDLLLRLATSSDVGTRRQLAHGARALARADTGVAAQVLLAVDFEGSTEIVDETFGAFTRRHGYLNWLDLPQTARTTLIERLLRAPSLEDHQIMVFLSERSAEDPDTTLRLLLDRIERSESEGHTYRPLPFQWHETLRFRSAPNFGELLRTIRDWVAESTETWQREHFGADLFSAVAVDFDDEVLQILEDGVATGDESQIHAVGALLSEAPRALVWDRTEVIVRLLQSASHFDPDLAGRLMDGLHTAVITGGRSGTPGQPFPEDVEQRDRSRLVVQGLPFGSVERRFYDALISSAESSVRRAERDGETIRDGRRW